MVTHALAWVLVACRTVLLEGSLKAVHGATNDALAWKSSWEVVEALRSHGE